MKSSQFAIAGLALLLVGAGCSTTPTATTPASTSNDAYSQLTVDTASPTPVTPMPTSTTPDAGAVNPAKITTATLHTSMGDVTIEFFPDQAPKTVENFIKLAQSGFYNDVKFHRVIKDFMIQGGDPLTKDDSLSSEWGTGGPGYKFADEISANNKNDVGTIAMANAGPNTNGSQFFINVNANNFLDTKHTVFGKVVKGMEVVTAIENTPTSAGDRPVTAVVIKSIDLK